MGLGQQQGHGCGLMDYGCGGARAWIWESRPGFWAGVEVVSGRKWGGAGEL